MTPKRQKQRYRFMNIQSFELCKKKVLMIYAKLTRLTVAALMKVNTFLGIF